MEYMITGFKKPGHIMQTKDGELCWLCWCKAEVRRMRIAGGTVGVEWDGRFNRCGIMDYKFDVSLVSK